MTPAYDAVVVGSGFGGAILACRLSEAGMKVLVLERGRRWTAAEFPRRPDDPWLFSSAKPETHTGWLDLRFFKHMIVAQGAGVGGGSLTYSSVAVEADAAMFSGGSCPPEITYAELKPHYETVARMMHLQSVPDGQLTQRFKLAREAAEKLGHAHRFSKAPLAVSFSPEWHYGLDAPFDHRHSRRFTNAEGQQQGTCIHLGNCDIGCDVGAKNTLDLNYIPRAERHGAVVRPLHLVRTIAPAGNGYRVVYDALGNGRAVRGEETAARVFVAAGSLGTTELLLRCRDEHRTLPRLSPALGHGWSANGNVLSMASYADPARVQQSAGPTISAMLDFMDGSAGGHRFVIEDDGFPDLLRNAMRACMRDGSGTALGKSLLSQLDDRPGGSDGTRNIMVWLGAGSDSAPGRLALERPLLTPWKRRLDLRWPPESARALVETILALHRSMTEATGGRVQPDVAWRLFRSMVTLHPLGGCRMGTDVRRGVVDHLGQVFGYPNLYVVDGSILPCAAGRNPSHTIAALAERTAAHVS